MQYALVDKIFTISFFKTKLPVNTEGPMPMIGGDSLLISVPTLIHILSCPHKKWPAMFT